ncbi:MAG: purine-binding chemotaxis protein CheW [Calditrichaeota bacterium]|nr:MAG: purine-binding chemotaxis protein CheW [Calditrichota bacterium]
MNKRPQNNSPNVPQEREAFWAALHRRLQQVEQMLGDPRGLSPEEKQRILKARAAELSRPRTGETSTAGEPLREVVVFRLGEERYAVETRHVREVLPLREITPVPCTPAFVAGIINVRGEIFSVIDLKIFFHLPAQALTDSARVLIVHNDQMAVGVLADGVEGVQPVRDRELQPPPATLSGIQQEFLTGVTGERLILLNMERILNDPGLIVQESVAI